MSDLISRSALLGVMDARYREKQGNVPDNLAEGFMQMEKLIKEQPTAYDLDKVVERLEEKALGGIHGCQWIPLESAIDIVRAGGKGETMKIKEVNDEFIVFEDGSYITYDHEQDCCECNYADFRQLEETALETEFDVENMVFEVVEDSGFRFGNEGKMFFVPCYSDQNGYYSSDVDIYFKCKKVISVFGEIRE